MVKLDSMSRMQFVDFSEPCRVHMGVDLGSAYIGMSEELLYHTDIRAVGQHVRSEAMPQDVRRYPVRRDPDIRRALLYYLEHALPREWPPKPRHENVRLRQIPLREGAASRIEICIQRMAGGLPDRHEALFAAFTEDPQQLPFRHEIIHLETTKLRDAQSAAIYRIIQYIFTEDQSNEFNS